MMGKYNNHIVMAVGDVFDANNTNEEPDHDAMIERLMPKLTLHPPPMHTTPPSRKPM
jgi:hypothetical protein